MLTSSTRWLSLARGGCQSDDVFINNTLDIQYMPVRYKRFASVCVKMSDDRFSDNVRASSSYSCHVCAFSTQRKDNYMRHMQSSRHARHFVSPQDVCDCEDPLPEMSGWHSPESDESDAEQPTDHEVNAAGDTHAPQYDVERG